jgi:hypothetical protein
MGCSRNTIRRHLKLQAQRQPVVYGPRPQRVGKLVLFVTYRRRAQSFFFRRPFLPYPTRLAGLT